MLKSVKYDESDELSDNLFFLCNLSLKPKFLSNKFIKCYKSRVFNNL